MFCRACGLIVPKMPEMSWEQWENKKFCDKWCLDLFQAGKRARPRSVSKDRAAEQAWREYCYRIQELHHLWGSDSGLNVILRSGWPSPDAFIRSLWRHEESELLVRFMAKHQCSETGLRAEWKERRVAA